MAAWQLLQCGDCGILFKSVDEAQRHAEYTSHTNFCESSEAFLYLLCTACSKVCRSKSESNFHTKWTGHTEFQDKTEEGERRAREEEERRVREERRAREEEERKAKEICQQLAEALKAIKTKQLGLLPRDSALPELNRPALEEEKISSTLTKAAQMRECLRTLKQNHMVEEAKVKKAFNTLLTYAKNVAMYPDEEKFRKIRLSNAAFQDRIGNLQGGIEFLELCGFEKIEGGQFLYLPRDKVDMEVLHSAGHELNHAITTPFFEIL